MQSTIRTAFITDLLLPPPNSLPNLHPTELSAFGYDAALAILQNPEAFIRSNPLVTNVRLLTSPSDSKNYINVPEWCSVFNLDHRGSPERGIGSEWQQFEITDKLNWGLGSSDLIYVTAMRQIPGGFESVTSPGSGVRIYGRFEILRPSELSRLSSKPTNLSGPDPDDGTTTSRPNTKHDYTSNAPNTVPGWPLASSTNPPAASSADPSAKTLTPPSRPTTSSSQNASSADDNTGIIHFIEHNETRCNALLSLYIKATTAKSHRSMHENFKRRWSELIKDGLSGHATLNHGGGGGGGGGRAADGVASGGGGGKMGGAVGAGERKVGGSEGMGLDARAAGRGAEERRRIDANGPRQEEEESKHQRTGSEMRTTLR